MTVQENMELNSECNPTYWGVCVIGTIFISFEAGYGIGYLNHSNHH